MKITKKPKMILFDYGHTLYDESKFNALAGNQAILRHVTNNPYGVTAEELVEKSDEMNGHLGRYGITKEHDYIHEIHNIPFTRYLYEYYGLEFDRSIYDIESIFWDHAAPGVPTVGINGLLATLKSQGIRMAVISNLSFSGEALKSRIEQAIDLSYFEFILSTSDYIFRKPTTHIFELALRKAGLEPEECWYCGDNVHCDVEGAAAMHIIPVWYRGANPTGVYNGKEGLDVTPVTPDSDHLVINHWQEVVELLKGLNDN